MIHNVTANIGEFGFCNCLVHLFLWGANVFTLDSNEHYFRSRNLALTQDSHSLRGSTRDPWTVYMISTRCMLRSARHSPLNQWEGLLDLRTMTSRKQWVRWSSRPLVCHYVGSLRHHGDQSVTPGTPTAETCCFVCSLFVVYFTTLTSLDGDWRMINEKLTGTMKEASWPNIKH
jgi:hypothetical protein